MDNLVDKVLGTPTTVTLQELLGASTMASKKILDYLCVTRPTQHISENINSLEKSYLLNHDKPAMVNPKTNHQLYNLLDARLVNLTVSFKNGHVVNALIDPGSELDIMGHETWLQTSKPMDRRTTTLMRGASNHVTNLQGKCFNVDLTSGNFKTTSDFGLEMSHSRSYVDNHGKFKTRSISKNRTAVPGYLIELYLAKQSGKYVLSQHKTPLTMA